jgi:hypothetical protein
MNKYFFMIFSIAFFSANAQDTLKIPNGIVYKKASNEVNEAAKKAIRKELNKTTTSYDLFDNLLYVGPMLWRRYSSIPSLAKIQGGDIQFRVPAKGAVSVLPGKLIQNNIDFKSL